MVQILTNKEMKIIHKRLSNKKLSQNERNRLSKAIRPKLREISKIDAAKLLLKIEYLPNSIHIENTIIKIIRTELPEVHSIILYGSAIQTNYTEYNDIDILVITNKKVFSGFFSKAKKIRELINIFKGKNINADIDIIDKKSFITNYSSSPALLFQLKDCKIIYGDINIPEKINLYKVNLHMKLDWSKLDNDAKGNEIYRAIRNVLLVRLLLNRVIDNSKLIEVLHDELGKNLILKLKNNSESKMEKKYALNYLNQMIKKTRNDIKGELWEKIQI